MLKLDIKNETAQLKAVVLGRADSNGPTPTPQDAYDPKSLEHILAGTYPMEEDMIAEMTAFEQVLKKHNVVVYRPRLIPHLNQIFTRDIGFVIEDTFVKSNILPDRADEWEAIDFIIEQIAKDKFVTPPEEVHIEGGDVIVWNDYVFIGTYYGADYSDINTARTNQYGVNFIKELFPHKTIIDCDLIKSMTNPRANALHLDCCFQPIGVDKGIIFKGGFRNPHNYHQIVEIFGEENLFHIDANGMYDMNSNVFSISPDIIVSEQRFDKLNNWLEEHGFTVEKIPYHEIGKQEGLLRCSTLPLIRE
ncbi:MAG: dimethylarginine dimethylaminohydrolase family protein [Sphingobacterium composti]|uniref:dimethylarginine dimethylaminohydrolase family protein n=1 Tax=Sphingobacterium composti TaxID=363260 RepID=UPI001359E07B|nr:arginine deiminase family protein [Sphingobacterium composti Ten et al. 2007 non Yoo et al. 2007]